MDDDLLTAAEWRKILRQLDLSPRQGQILRAIVENKTDSEIATELKLSRSAVRTYVARMTRTLAVKRRVGLVVHVFRVFRHLDRRKPATK